MKSNFKQDYFIKICEEIALSNAGKSKKKK